MTCLCTGRHCCSVYKTLPGNMQTCHSSTVAAIACMKCRLATWEILSCHALCETQIVMQHAPANKRAGLCAELPMRRAFGTLCGNQRTCRCSLTSQCYINMSSILKMGSVRAHHFMVHMFDNICSHRHSMTDSCLSSNT